MGKGFLQTRERRSRNFQPRKEQPNTEVRTAVKPRKNGANKQLPSPPEEEWKRFSMRSGLTKVEGASRLLGDLDKIARGGYIRGAPRNISRVETLL